MRLIQLSVLAALLALASACVGEIKVGDAPPDDDGVDAGFEPGVDAGDETAPDAGFEPGVDAGEDDPPPPEMVWKAVLMTGDDSINAFDNARDTVKTLFEVDGVLDENTIQLSRDAGEQVGGVRATSVDNFQDAMLDLDVGANDGCVVFMTSHGSQEGFYIRGSSTLTPTRLDQILEAACGDRPTVAMISACYSGVFVDPSARPNRIILTAAREDRTSFGCSAEATYTYWDGCLIENFPTSDTWEDLYDNVAACISAKEGVGGFTPSHPQGFFGADMRGARIFYR